MEVIFQFTVREGFRLSDQLSDLIQNRDFKNYLKSQEGKVLSMSLIPAVKQSEKDQLYAYYHRVVLGVAMQCFSDDGWVGVDKVKADYMLKAECAKSIIYNSKTGEEDIYLEDKKDMNKERLYKYVSDCINFLEMERGYKVPDSQSFRIKKGFK